MNFDLITKLAKLANNNPNEAEANSAARKVCKLLAEANFQFTGEPVKQKVQQGPVGDPFSSTDFYDWFYRFAQRDRARTQEQQRTEQQRKQNYYTGYDPTDRQRQYYQEQKNKEQEYWTRKAYQGSWTEEPKNKKWPGDDPFKKPSEQAKSEKRLLKCKTCKNSKLTSFVGAAELFECNNCQWTAYAAKSEK